LAAGTSTGAAVGVTVLNASGAAAGTGQATAVGAADIAASGSAAGTSTGAAVGVTVLEASGSAAGTGSASAVGSTAGTTATGVGAATGTGDATGVGVTVLEASGAAAGSGQATGVGAYIAASAGSSAGTGTAAAVGSATSEAVGFATGTGAATGVGAATIEAVASATGVGAAAFFSEQGLTSGVAAGTGDATGVGAAIIFEHLHPDADDAVGTWTNELDTTPLYPSIDESTANDADYIKSAVSPAVDIARFRISDPSAGMGYPGRVNIRYKRDGAGVIDLTVRLKQSTTSIATWVLSDIPDTYTDSSLPLTTGEFNAITDFTELFIELQADEI
jgi:hypothetical protein